MSVIAPLLNKSRMRIKRDHKRLIGAIKASAFLHQYQRETLTIGYKTWIVANEEDFKTAWRHGEKPFARALRILKLNEEFHVRLEELKKKLA